MEINSWLTGHRGVSLPFSDYCPCLYRNIEDLKTLWGKALSFALSKNWKRFELRGVTDELNGRNHSNTFLTHSLALKKDGEALFNSFASSNRRAIRKAEKSDVRVEVSNTIDDLRAFYHLLCLTRRRHGLPPQPWRFFENLYSNVVSQGFGNIFLAYHDRTPIAGSLFLHRDKTVTYKYGASDRKFQNLRANNLLMWRAIQHFAAEGYVNLNFGRTSPSNEGLRRFKLQWTSEETSLFYDRVDPQNHQIEQTHDETEGWFNHIFRMMPLPISRLVGSALYKHVA